MLSTTVPRRGARRGLTLTATGVATLTVAALLTSTPATAASDTLSPVSLTTTAGSIGSGQTVANLVAKDQSGSQDDWGRYVEFIGAYAGYRTYELPAGVDAADVTAIEVTTNYRGPSTSTQTWTWSLYDWAASSWNAVGTNASASSWGSWKQLTFDSPTNAASFVNSAGDIRVRLSANNSADAANVDHEALQVTSSDGSGGSTTITLPPANGGFSYQLGGAYTPESGVEIVSRDRTAPPAGAGFYNICYVNLLQTQPDYEGQSPTNPDYGTTQWWINNHPNLLLRDANGDLIADDEWSEAIFDVSTPTKRQQLLAIQHDWFADCKDDGYQAIEPDNLDVFLRSEGQLTFAQTKEYLKLVVPEVHDLGLAIAQKNTGETGQGYGTIGKTFVDTVSPAQGFDFAIAEECARYLECDTYTDVYGPHVLEIEYTDENEPVVHDGETEPRTPFDWICDKDGDERPIILRDRNLVTPSNSAYFYASC